MSVYAHSAAVESRAIERTWWVEGSRFDRLVAGISGWLIGGIWLDAWAHDNVPGLETFFTPWHGVLYSGLLAMFGVLIAPLLSRGRAVAGVQRLAWLPAGYELSLVGAAVFGLGGLADMVWHLLFGIEVDLEALLSPSHLLLAAGGVLMVSGPLRAAWQRPVATGGRPLGWGEGLPVLLSLTFVLSLLTFFTAYANPFSIPWPARSNPVVDELAREFAGGTVPAVLGQSIGLASILLQAALLMGTVLLAARRWVLPFGALTLLFTLNMVLGVLPHGQYAFVPVALLAGLVGDTLLQRTSAQDEGNLRLVAFAIPAVLFGLYFLVLAVSGGIAWTVHLWAGAILLAGVVGLLLSFVATLQPAAGAGGTRAEAQPS